MIAPKVYIGFRSFEDSSRWGFRTDDGVCGNCEKKKAGATIEGEEYTCFICWECLDTIKPEKKKRAGIIIEGEEHNCSICWECVYTLTQGSK